MCRGRVTVIILAQPPGRLRNPCDGGSQSVQHHRHGRFPSRYLMNLSCQIQNLRRTGRWYLVAGGYRRLVMTVPSATVDRG
jgi:hypothetical protein